ncbi:Cep120 protein-domain-containing protein [Chytriomyces sp. MP71]|nr:Cep120 protein-domain-containing protein [Chytriomyces sp. MP71]
MNTVLVTVREGRQFASYAVDGASGSSTRVYLQCRFNNEILTTDPVPLTSDPVWDTDLAWEIGTRQLQFIRTQRAKLKLACFAISAQAKRVQIGYIMLDLRSASSIASPNWNADPEVDKDAAWAWYPLVYTAPHSRKNNTSVFRPEIKLAFSIVQKIDPPPSQSVASSPPRKRNPQPNKKKIASGSSPFQPQLLSSPKAIRIQLYPDANETPTPVIQFNQNQTLFTTTSGLPIELTPTGCYQIGFNGPNWLLNFTIAFAEHLSILHPTVVPDAPASEANDDAEGFYFSYTFLGNTVTTTPFPSLQHPAFPAERVSFRVRAARADLARFLADVEVLVVCLCVGADAGRVLGFAEVPLAGVLDAVAAGEEGEGEKAGGVLGEVVQSVYGDGFRARPRTTAPVSLSRSQSPALLAGAGDRAAGRGGSRVVERVVTFYDARQELRVDVEGRVAGLGVSVVVTPDLQSDLVEAERGGIERSLLGEEDVFGVHEDGTGAGNAAAVAPSVLETDGGADHAYGGADFEEYEADDGGNVPQQPAIRTDPNFVERRAVSPGLREGLESPDLAFDYPGSPQPQPQPQPVQASRPAPVPPSHQQQTNQQQQQQQPHYSTFQRQQQMKEEFQAPQAYLQQQQPLLQSGVLLNPVTAPSNRPQSQIPVKAPAPWHQYRFSIDLRSIRGLDPRHGPIFLKYTYTPFGTTSPITTHPPVKPVAPTTPGVTQNASLDLPNAFCAFEFVMGAERLLTYLEAVPLAVEVWTTDRYERNARVGLATVDLSVVAGKESREVPGPVRVMVQSADLVVGVVAAKPVEAGDGGGGGSNIVKIADLRVVVALEDFGPVEDVDLFDESVAPVALPAGGAVGAAPDSALADPPQDLHRGPSPTFTKVSHGAGVMASENTHSSKIPTAHSIRQRETTPPRAQPPHSPTPSSLHETQEYRAALEIALWKKAEMAQFRQHLATLQQALVGKLTAEFARRDARRVASVRKRVEALEALEGSTRDVLTQLEAREAGVRAAETAALARREEGERVVRRREAEVEDSARRLAEEFRARVEVERVKALEAEAARIRAMREREETEGKLKRLEADFEAFRRNVMEGKVSGMGVTPGEVGEAAVAAIKAELTNVVVGSAAVERRAEQLEASKKHYKAQWIRALRDLAKTKKALQAEIEDRLKRSQKELDTVKMRMMAKDEMGSMENERRVIDAMKREILGLKAASSATSSGVGNSRKPQVEGNENSAASRIGEQRKEDASGSVGGSGSAGDTALKVSHRQNLDPRVLAEVERLVKERDSLLNTGIYARDDRLIRELDTRISSLLRSR